MARYLGRLAVLASIAAVAVPVATAQAAQTGRGGGLLGKLLGGGCGPTSQPFAQWGDRVAYDFPANGGFEQGSDGWTLSDGAAVVPGNESFSVHDGSDSSSLEIPAGGSASTSVCYGLTYPGFRFFAESTGDGPATIHVKVVTRNLLGVLSALDGGTFQVGSDWQPSPRMSSLLSAIAAPFGSKSMTIEIQVESGSARIDDLYIDPFLRLA